MQRIPKIEKIWTAKDIFPEAKIHKHSNTRDLTFSLNEEDENQEIKIKVRKAKKPSTDWLGRRQGKIRTNRKKFATGTHTVPGVRKPRTNKKKNVYIRVIF